MPDDVAGSVAVYDGHLDVHEDYVRFSVCRLGLLGFEEVVECFFAVPDRFYLEAQFLDGLGGDFLVDLTKVMH